MTFKFNEHSMKFHYYRNGRKQGPITNDQLAAFVRQGIIVPTSILETETGYRGEACQIPGLFAFSTSANHPGMQTRRQSPHEMTTGRLPAECTKMPTERFAFSL